MLGRILSATMLAVLAGALGLQTAHADIYTWVDASGRVNMSNLLPPEGVRVTSVTHETPQDPAMRDAAAREVARQAELQALADRVRQLETEVAVAQRPAPPPPVVYMPVPAPAPVQYQADTAPPAYGWCDPSWASCWGGWFPGLYPGSLVVVQPANSHRRYFAHAGRGFTGQRPVRGSIGVRGR